MKEEIKESALVLFCVGLFLLYAVIMVFRSCHSERSEESTLVTPDDSTFMPTDHRQYRPPIMTWPPLSKESASSHLRLPKGVKEKDVQRVVSLTVAGLRSPVNVIETKDGAVYVEKDSSIEKVEVTDYLPPVIGFGIFPGVGISITRHPERSEAESKGLTFSPMAKVAFVELLGTVRLPMIAADINGFGLGSEVRLYNDVFVGVGYFANYSDVNQRQIKVTLQFNF